MPATKEPLSIERDAPIPTWFGIGGSAHRLARPRDEDQLLRCIEIEPALRILGAGANLLVDDEGVGGLVVAFDAPAWKRIEIDEPAGRVRAGAGVDLAKLIHVCQRAGLAGLENLGGVPATVGGALRMNAGGRYGEIGPLVALVHAIDRAGESRSIPGEEIAFGYRTSGLGDLIITGVELALERDDPPAIRERLLAIMRDKKHSQPLGASCAGCCFKNPLLGRDIDGIGSAGQRIGAGLIIDRAGCKGLRRGGAEVSPRHANFITADKSARARDVIGLMEEVAARVADRFGIGLQRELVVWESHP